MSKKDSKIFSEVCRMLISDRARGPGVPGGGGGICSSRIIILGGKPINGTSHLQ